MRDGRLKPITSLLIGFVGVVAVGVLDDLTGYEVRLYPLYMLPLSYVAWRSSRVGTVILALLSAGIWAASKSHAGQVYSSDFIWFINVTSQFVAFAFPGLLLVELRRRLGREQELSRRDPVTRLLNARAFYERGEGLLALARRTSRPFTVAFLDLDNFKKVNDAFGHPAGDRALGEVAEVLAKQIRASDLVARVGGDEFAIFLYETDWDAAHVSLRRVLNEVANRMKNHGWPATVSIGAVTYTIAPGSLEEAVQAADTQLLAAKQAGKNRVQIMRSSNIGALAAS